METSLISSWHLYHLNQHVVNKIIWCWIINMRDERKARLGGGRYVGKPLSPRGEPGSHGPGRIKPQAHRGPTACGAHAPSRGAKLQQSWICIWALPNSPVTLGHSLHSLGLIFYLSFETRIIMPTVYNAPWLLNGIKTWGAWHVDGAYLEFNKC